MAEFKPINSQEELDAIVKTAVAEAIGKYADYDKVKNNAAAMQKALDAANSTISAHDAAVKSLNDEISSLKIAAEKTRIANELGLPFDFGARLTGTTEDEIKADALVLQKTLLGVKQPAPPMFNPTPEPEPVNSKNGAVSKWLQQMKGE